MDALDRLICADPSLAEAELRMVQTYYALRQVVGPERQAPLKTEFLRYAVDTRAMCGLPPVQPGRDQSGVVPPATASACVHGRFDDQRARWAGRLSGPAAEEAARDPAANIALQARLRDLALLPADVAPDGVFGTATRTAILAWQRSSGRPETGFLGYSDATALLPSSDTAAAAPQDPWARLTVAPLAEVAFKGKPVSATAGGTTVALAPGRSANAASCAKAKNALLPDASEPAPDNGKCDVVTVTVTVAGRTAFEAPLVVTAAGADLEALQVKAALRRLMPGRSSPEIVLQAYTGGAHCCTTVDVLTATADGTFRSVPLGSLDGDGGYAFLDPVHDGSTVLVAPAGEFPYRFASYAGSFAPLRLQRFTGEGLADISRDPDVASFQRAELRRMSDGWRSSDHGEPNGYYSAWVAQKALVGEFESAWPVMLKSYDRSSTDGLIDCSMDLSASAAAKALSLYECPAGYKRRGTFPEALASFLIANHYITAEQAKAVGSNVSVLAAERASNAAWFDQRMDQTWFVIDAKGACVEPRPAKSPADLVMAVRARGQDPVVDVVESTGTQPAIVSVSQRLPNGNASRTTFFHGALRCSAFRDRQQAELQKLK